MNPKKIILNTLDITALLNAFARFDEARTSIEDDLDRDGAIQRFEYTFELTWKTLKRILHHKGLVASNPRDTFRLAAREGYIADPVVWFDFLEKRNLTSHTYKEEIAQQISEIFDSFNDEMKSLISKIENL